MQLIKPKMGIILASLLLISGCTHTIVKPAPLPLPVCEDLAQIHPTELITTANGNVVMSQETMVKIVKRDAQRRACTKLHRAVIKSTHKRSP